MTFDDDFCRIKFTGGTKNIACIDLQVSWPPPQILDISGFKFNLIGYSKITDEQREGMSNVCRGAEYNSLDNMK